MFLLPFDLEVYKIDGQAFLALCRRIVLSRLAVATAHNSHVTKAQEERKKKSQCHSPLLDSGGREANSVLQPSWLRWIGTVCCQWIVHC